VKGYSTQPQQGLNSAPLIKPCTHLVVVFGQRAEGCNQELREVEGMELRGLSGGTAQHDTAQHGTAWHRSAQVR